MAGDNSIGQSAAAAGRVDSGIVVNRYSLSWCGSERWIHRPADWLIYSAVYIDISTTLNRCLAGRQWRAIYSQPGTSVLPVSHIYSISRARSVYLYDNNVSPRTRQNDMHPVGHSVRLTACGFLLVFYSNHGWLASRVVSVLDSGAEGRGFKSQSRRCRVTVLGKLFTPIVPLFTKQRNW